MSGEDEGAPIRLDGRRLLVVGASSGIGRALAQRAVALGASVAMAARRADRLAHVIERSGGGFAVVGDVRDPGACAQIVADAVAALGGLDALVYSTGLTPLVPLVSADSDHWHDVLAINTVGASLVTAAALPHLGPRGLCAYLSSDVTHLPRPGMATYGASKAALDSLIVGWRLEHPEHRFCRVVVGPTARTEAGSGMDHDLAAQMFPQWVARGVQPAAPMDAVDLGALLAETVALLLAHPDVSVHDLRVEPPGPILTADGTAAGGLP